MTFKVFIKPFEAPRRNVKRKILVNSYFNTRRHRKIFEVCLSTLWMKGLKCSVKAEYFYITLITAITLTEVVFEGNFCCSVMVKYLFVYTLFTYSCVFVFIYLFILGVGVGGGGLVVGVNKTTLS